MPNPDLRWRHAALAGAALLLGSLPASSVVFTDGSLSISLEDDGEFDSVFLEGFQVDGSPNVVAIEGTCNFIMNSSDIAINGNTATYTGECSTGDFSIEVTTTLLGPVPGASDLTGVVEQAFVFTNTSGAAAPLQVLSEVDTNLAQSSDDFAVFDESSGIATLTDPFEPVSMTATSSTPDPATFGWDVSDAVLSIDFPTHNRSGPVGPADVAVVLGYDFGDVPDLGVRTVTYRYEFYAPAAPPDSYLCYKTGARSSNGVSLSDRFDSGAYQSKKFRNFCIPVSVDSRPIGNPASYLSGFQLKGPHAKQSQLSLEHHFGTFTYDTVKTDSLLVPTDWGSGQGANVSYRCVKAKTSKRTPKLPKGLSGSLADEIGVRTAAMKKATRVCSPTSVGGGAAPASTAYLVCFKIKVSPKAGKFEADVSNTFGSGFIDVKKEAELCVPAVESE
jgi:hypothetical protein